MHIIGIGTEIVECLRIGRMIELHGEQFLTRVYTAEEIHFCQGRRRSMEHFAARWAAKEAVIKAWSGSRFAQRPVLPEGIHRDIEVITDMWGRPKVRLTGAIAQHLAEVTIHVSLTHEGDTAAAVAILETS